MIQTLEKAAVLGHFDGVENGIAMGWAYNPADPTERVHVEVICGAEVMAFGIADQFRADLAPAGIGDGKHLFRLPISYELMDGRVHLLEVREATSGTSLRGSPISFGPEERRQKLELISRASGLSWLENLLKTPEFGSKEKKPGTFKKLYQIGSLAQETGRMDDARYAWDVLLKAMGNNALCFCKIGETHLLEGNATLALKAYLSAGAEDLTARWVHLGIAEAKQLLGRPLEAQEAREMANSIYTSAQPVKANSDKELALHALYKADLLLSEGKRDDALQVLKKTLINAPENKDVVHKIGNILADGERHIGNLPGMDATWRLRKTQLTLELFLSD